VHSGKHVLTIVDKARNTRREIQLDLVPGTLHTVK
jgi:hypothetical protein